MIFLFLVRLFLLGFAKLTFFSARKKKILYIWYESDLYPKTLINHTKKTNSKSLI